MFRSLQFMLEKIHIPKHLKTVAKFKLNRVLKLFVERQLKSLKRNKSLGLDDLPPQLLKGLFNKYIQTFNIRYKLIVVHRNSLKHLENRKNNTYS